MIEILNQPITLGQLMLFSIIYSFVHYFIEKTIKARGQENDGMAQKRRGT